MTQPYTILPFRFSRFDDEEYLLTNDVGEYIFLRNNDFDKFIRYELDPHSPIFQDIASKQISTTDKVEDVVNMLATKFRTKKSILRNYTWSFLLYVAIQVVYIVKLLVKILMIMKPT